MFALVSLSIWVAQAADQVLTLACQGAASDATKADDATPQPISMGLIINFTARTIAGFTDPRFGNDFPQVLNITAMNEVSITFGGANKSGNWTITGKIDRVTGGAEALEIATIAKAATSYLLHCKPTQRMF